MIFDKDILVSYNDMPYARLRRGFTKPEIIDKTLFDSLKDELPIIEYNNDYLPVIYLQLTTRCNMKCIHCFAYADNEAYISEWKYDELLQFLYQAKECGVGYFILTGGEPLAHPDFLKIVDEIYNLGMKVMDLNTNGILLSDEMLNELEKYKDDINMKISFDGIGTHDYFRGVPGCEDKVKKIIEKCVKKGYRTFAQVQLNHKTLPRMQETLAYLDKVGCKSARLLRTSDAPRWVNNNKGETIKFDEYYDVCFDICEKYLSTPHKMCLDIWQFLYLNPNKEIPYGDPNEYVRKESEDAPLCQAIKRRVSVAADGEVYPCLEMQGYCNSNGIHYGNVKKDTLQGVLSSSDYSKTVCISIHDRFEHNEKCRDCEYRSICTGGCPCLGTLFSGGDYLGVDESRCKFFFGGTYEKILKLQNKESN